MANHSKKLGFKEKSDWHMQNICRPMKPESLAGLSVSQHLFDTPDVYILYNKGEIFGWKLKYIAVIV